MERIDVRFKLFLLGAIASLSLLAVKQVSAQQRIPLAIDDALNTRTLPASSRVAASPDGRWVALTLHENRRSLNDEIGLAGQTNPRTGVSDESDASDVWIVHTEDGKATNLTGGEGSNWEPTWSPDGSSIAFLSDRDGGETNVWLWTVRDRAMRRVSKRAVRAVPGIRMQWTPDSKRVLVTTLPEDMTASEYARSVASVGKASDKDSERRTTVTLFTSEATRLSGERNSAAVMTNLDEAYRHDLVLIDVATGVAETLVRNERVRDYSLSHDGATVAYAFPKRFYRPASWQVQCDLITVEVKSKRRRVLASEVILAPEFRWSPTDAVIVFGASNPSDESAGYYLVSRDGASSRKVLFPANRPLRHAARPSWDKTGQWFYFVNEKSLWRASVADASAVRAALVPDRAIVYALECGEGDLWMPGEDSAVVLTHDEDSKQDGFYRVDLSNGAGKLLLERAQSYVMMPFTGLAPRRIAVSGDQRFIVFIAEDSQHPPDVWVSDARFRHPRQLTHLNPQFDRYELGKTRLMEWISDDGKRLKGALLLPSAHRKDEVYPLLVWVHFGANFSEHLNSFALGEFPGPFNMQLLATRGYAVLFPQQANSDIPFDPAGGLVKSVLPGISKAVELGIADVDRVGVMGHSAGGVSTLALITRTHRFRAAIEASGYGDYTADYGTMAADGSGYQYLRGEQELGGAPWEHPDRYVQNSPIYFLDRVDTPLLIVQGTADRQVGTFLADEIFVGLRRLSKSVEYAKYEGASHAPAEWSYANQVDLTARVLDWWNRFLAAPK